MNHQEDHFRLATDIHNSLFFAKLVFSVVLSAPSTFLFLDENIKILNMIRKLIQALDLPWLVLENTARTGKEGKKRWNVVKHKLNDILPRDSLKQFEWKEKPWSFLELTSPSVQANCWICCNMLLWRTSPYGKWVEVPGPSSEGSTPEYGWMSVILVLPSRKRSELVTLWLWLHNLIPLRNEQGKFVRVVLVSFMSLLGGAKQSVGCGEIFGCLCAGPAPNLRLP